MEAPEVPTEHLHEALEHETKHSGERWVLGVALSAAIIAALAAIASLLAGANANEAMIDQMQASDQWSYYQAKGIKSSVLAGRIELLSALGKQSDPADAVKLAAYKKEQEAIQAEAEEKQAGSRHHLHIHEIMARSVTLLQVAIAICAVSVLTKRRRFWYLSLVFAAIGLAFLLQGLAAGR
ncbi:MAG: DUF4337 domain-containing protein [Methylacidiphilales bacterium]|nr:DUF4337 domain-containing protein [Candidatus Methylacidiphilales bacterium]